MKKTQLRYCCLAVALAALPGMLPAQSVMENLNFRLQASMKGSSSLLTANYSAINTYMRNLGWDYTEHPNSSANDHNTGVHCVVRHDANLGQYFFRFISHAGEFLDYDRGSKFDRQRNEMKTRTGTNYLKMNGNLNEWERLKWKFRIPKGFRPSTNFTHIHQLKAQEGNNSAPLITLTARANADGTNFRLQVIHTGDVSANTKGTLVDNLPLAEFEGEWVEATTTMYFSPNGYFHINLTRVSDGKVLLDKEVHDIDLWRTGATNIRSKFGIYRSLGSTMDIPDGRPTNGIKDDSLDLADFRIYEATGSYTPVGIHSATADERPVDVYTLEGHRVAAGVPRGRATEGLRKDIYVIERRKVAVK